MTQDNDQRVRTRNLSWKEICQKAWGKDWNKPETVYEFSGGKTFETTDRGETGIYRAPDEE